MNFGSKQRVFKRIYTKVFKKVLRNLQWRRQGRPDAREPSLIFQFPQVDTPAQPQDTPYGRPDIILS